MCSASCSALSPSWPAWGAASFSCLLWRDSFPSTSISCGALASWWPSRAPWPRGPVFCAASLRLTLPVALIASACSVVGAVIGLALPTDIVQTCLGCTILGIAFLLLFYRNSAVPIVTKQDAVGLALGIRGSFLEPTTGEIVDWKTHHTLPALLLFIVIGIMAGMFGLGAGWANVPAFNIIMGVPLKVGVGTSKFLLSVTDTVAAWVYLNQGCVIPLMAIPSIMGLMLGSLVGVRLLAHAKPKLVRYMVIVVLFFSGVRALMKGLGW